ncbi:MAG: MBL fold metallo-hydrolase [Bacteroidales bacterium]|nr:MBL fold metallo-hydrolase [Bacteroidales bacterium]MBP5572049.1 MBL fold metallo-hydrolase [Bacteroidales bacterium]
MEIYRFIFNRLAENTFVVEGERGECLVVDPGSETPSEQQRLEGFLESKGLRPAAVLLTHGHMDHTYGVAPIQQQYGCPVYMHDDDKSVVAYFQRVAKFGIPVPDPSFTTTPVSDGELIEAAGLSFKVIGTPGHSPGSVCYFFEEQRALFTGDTLFAGAIGRSDLFGGDYDSEIRAIMEKLMLLDGDIAVYPGHGGSTSIADERTGNPFLEPFNEKEELYDQN